MTLRSRFHYFTDALLVCDYRQHLQVYQILLYHLTVFTQLTFTLPKPYVWQQSGCINSSMPPHPAPESWHVLQSLQGVNCSCTLLLRIFTGGHQSKGFQFTLICISHSPHPKDPALRPPGNPSEICPLLSRLAQETVVVKRPKPSQKWQINSSI